MYLFFSSSRRGATWRRYCEAKRFPEILNEINGNMLVSGTGLEQCKIVLFLLPYVSNILLYTALHLCACLEISWIDVTALCAEIDIASLNCGSSIILEMHVIQLSVVLSARSPSELLLMTSVYGLVSEYIPGMPSAEYSSHFTMLFELLNILSIKGTSMISMCNFFNIFE